MQQETGSITHWIGSLRAGSEQATQEIWQRFHERLLTHARRRLSRSKKRVADEDDVVVCAFNSFFHGAREGRFARLDDRDDLWQVLLMIVNRKAANQMKALNRQKRGQTVTRGDSLFGEDSAEGANQTQFVSTDPAPELVVQIAEQFEKLLTQLDDPVLRQIALFKLEGFSNQEIATKLECQDRTVQRKLAVIRKLWTISQ